MLFFFYVFLGSFTGSNRVFYRLVPETMPVVSPTPSAAGPAMPTRPAPRPTALKSRQWSADTFAAGVNAVGLESKQEPWSDGEDDLNLLATIQVRIMASGYLIHGSWTTVVALHWSSKHSMVFVWVKNVLELYGHLQICKAIDLLSGYIHSVLS